MILCPPHFIQGLAIQCCWPGAQYVTSPELMAVLLPHPAGCWDHRYVTSPGHYWSSLSSLFFALLTLEHAPLSPEPCIQAAWGSALMPSVTNCMVLGKSFSFSGSSFLLTLVIKMVIVTGESRGVCEVWKPLKSVCYRVNAISMSLVPWFSDLLGAAYFCCLCFLEVLLSSVPPPAWLTQSLLWWQMADEHGPQTSSFNVPKFLQPM